MRKAELDSGSGFVTIPDLDRHFDSFAWSQLTQEGSPVRRLLSSKCFKQSGEYNTIDVEALKIFALLHC